MIRLRKKELELEENALRASLKEAETLRGPTHWKEKRAHFEEDESTYSDSHPEEKEDESRIDLELRRERGCCIPNKIELIRKSHVRR